MITIQVTRTELQVHEIESDTGFTIVQEGQITIPTSYNYSLHIIDLDDIHDIITSLTDNISFLPSYMQHELMPEILKLNDKLATLQVVHRVMRKRGILNFWGTIDKWLKGTMDDEDRQTINNHLTSIDANNHNIINTLNQQVQINNNFSISMQVLKKNHRLRPRSLS